MEVTINDQVINLKLPQSFSQRNEIATAAITNLHRAAAAALGVCWTGKGSPSTRYETSWSPLIYGGQVTDELVARGIPWSEIFAAGVVAYTYLAESLPREEEVATIEGFTEAGVNPSGAPTELNRVNPQ
jgi:hypothetical protein